MEQYAHPCVILDGNRIVGIEEESKALPFGIEEEWRVPEDRDPSAGMETKYGFPLL